MKSSKFRYRLVTAPNSKFAYQYQSVRFQDEWWDSFADYETLEAARQGMMDSADRDDFIPEVVAS